MKDDPIVIASAARTPMGGFMGDLKSVGAAAMVLMKRFAAERRGIAPLARIVACSSHSQEQQWFTTAPVGAVRKLFEMTGWEATASALERLA